MGIYNRDYIREDYSPGYGSHSGSGGNSPLKIVIVATCIVFFLQVVTIQNQRSLLTSWLRLDLASLQQFQLWRLVTYGFCHNVQSIMHVLFNMWAFYLFGRMIESHFTKAEFLAFYLVGIILSGLGYVLFQKLAGDPLGTVGASGGVMAITIYAALCYPHRTIMVMFVIPMQLGLLAILIVLLDFFGLMNPTGSHVAHASHLAGVIFGFLYHQNRWNLTHGFQQWWYRRKQKQRQTSANLRIYKEEEPTPQSDHSGIQDEKLNQQVDEILEKISQHGEEILTAEERKILTIASERYKKREPTP